MYIVKLQSIIQHLWTSFWYIFVFLKLSWNSVHSNFIFLINSICCTLKMPFMCRLPLPCLNVLHKVFSSFHSYMLNNFNYNFKNVYIEIVTKYNIYIWLDFLFLNKNHRGFSIYCVITEQLPYRFAFYCFQPQDKMSSPCPQAFHGPITL